MATATVTNPAPQGAETNAPRGANRGGRQTSYFNPESPSDLIAKFRKELGKTIVEIHVSYKTTGTSVLVELAAGLRREGEAEGTKVSPAEFLLRLKASKADAPRTEEQLVDDEYEFVTRYEKRLNKAFPTDKPANYRPATIKRWILQQPFEDRKILAMNAKQFRKFRRVEESDEEEEED